MIDDINSFVTLIVNLIAVIEGLYRFYKLVKRKIKKPRNRKSRPKHKR